MGKIAEIIDEQCGMHDVFGDKRVIAGAMEAEQEIIKLIEECKRDTEIADTKKRCLWNTAISDVVNKLKGGKR